MIETILLGAAANGAIDVLVRSEHGRDLRRTIAAQVTGKGWGLLELRPTAMTLEEIFLALVEQPAGAEGAVSPEVPSARD